MRWRVVSGLYVAAVCALALVTYGVEAARVVPLYVLLVLALPTSPAVAIALWVAIAVLDVVSFDVAERAAPFVAVSFWTGGAVLNVLIVRMVGRARRRPAPPTGAPGP